MMIPIAERGDQVVFGVPILHMTLILFYVGTV